MYSTCMESLPGVANGGHLDKHTHTPTGVCIELLHNWKRIRSWKNINPKWNGYTYVQMDRVLLNLNIGDSDGCMGCNTFPKFPKKKVLTSHQILTWKLQWWKVYNFEMMESIHFWFLGKCNSSNMKNWIALNRCSYIFHRINKVEVAVLHCKDCTENKSRCCEKFPLYLPAQEDETNGLWHLDLSKYLEDGRLNWQAIKMLVKTEHRI